MDLVDWKKNLGMDLNTSEIVSTLHGWLELGVVVVEAASWASNGLFWMIAANTWFTREVLQRYRVFDEIISFESKGL